MKYKMTGKIDREIDLGILWRVFQEIANRPSMNRPKPKHSKDKLGPPQFSAQKAEPGILKFDFQIKNTEIEGRATERGVIFTVSDRIGRPLLKPRNALEYARKNVNSWLKIVETRAEIRQQDSKD